MRRRRAEQFLAKLGLKPNQLDQLQQLPWEQVQEAFFAEPRIQGLANGPVVDGRSLPRDQWTPDAPAFSADVPLMLGSVETEDALERSAAAARDAGRRDDDARQAHRPQRRGEGQELVALYRGKHAGITNTDVWLIMNADNTRRANAQLLGELKSAQAKAPAYLYYFNWRSPGAQGTDEVVPHARHSVRALQHRHRGFDDRRDAQALRARAQDERGVGGVRSHRQPEPPGPAEVAGLQRAPATRR